jgi:DNA-binding NarL/FixJ family response regulator
LLIRKEVFGCGGEVVDEAIRVLVVEDQPIVRQAITAEFDRELGFDVRQAGSLADARALIGEVDVVVLDLGLPDGDGASLIGELKTTSPMARVLVLSSSIDPADAERALERGADAVLDKLADLDRVLATVKRLL